MITANSTLAEVAFEVCTALERVGYLAVLTGGSAATFYAPEAYQSGDLDFVLARRGEKGERALEELGFRRNGESYLHASSKLVLEFPPGPLAVGDELVTEWRTERLGDRVLHVLNPTDCCRDRLSAWLFWNDLAGLDQALFVHRARGAEVRLAVLRAWFAREGHARKYGLYLKRRRALSARR